MVISNFLIFGIVKFLKSSHNIVDAENLQLQIKIFEEINILLFFIQISIKM